MRFKRTRRAWRFLLAFKTLTWKDFEPDIPWIVPFYAFVLTATYWGLYLAFYQKLPVTKIIYLTEDLRVVLPFSISRAFDVILFPLLAYAFVRTFNRKWLEQVDLRIFILLGICCGFLAGYLSGLSATLPLSMVIGLTIGFSVGRDVGLKNGLVLSIGIGASFGFGILIGASMIFAIVKGLIFGLAASMLPALAFDFAIGVGCLIGVVLSVACGYVFPEKMEQPES